MRIILLVVMALVLSPSAHARDWKRADTDNFVFYSDGSAKKLSEFAVKAERFHTLLKRIFPSQRDEKEANRLTIYMLSKTRDVSKLAKDDDRSVAGFYKARADGSFAVSNRERGRGKFDLSGQAVLFHEYAHHYMYRSFTFAYPAWYREGFAEYLSTATFDKKGNWTFGKPPLFRGYGIMFGPKISAQTLLNGRPGQLEGTEARSAFYGRSWLLVHMMNSDAEKAAALTNYLRATAADMPVDEAVDKYFGGYEAIDKALDRYVDQRLGYRASNEPIPYEGRLEISELDEVSGELLELRLARRTTGLDDTLHAELRVLAETAPENAAVSYELALAEYTKASRESVPDFSSAKAHVSRALAADPQHVRARVLRSELEMEELSRDFGGKAEEWEAVREALLSAHQDDPTDPVPLAAYYESFEEQGVRPDATAREAIETAFGLAPEAINLRIAFAFDLANHGEFDMAERLIEILAQDPHHGRVASSVLETFEDMRAQRGGVVRIQLPDVETD